MLLAGAGGCGDAGVLWFSVAGGGDPGSGLSEPADRNSRQSKAANCSRGRCPRMRAQRARLQEQPAIQDRKPRAQRARLQKQPARRRPSVAGGGDPGVLWPSVAGGGDPGVLWFSVAGGGDPGCGLNEPAYRNSRQPETPDAGSASPPTGTADNPIPQAAGSASPPTENPEMPSSCGRDYGPAPPVRSR